MPRGRKPQNPELELGLGERSDRLKHDIAETVDGVPIAPKHLSKIAKIEFDRIVEDLKENGTLSRVDGSAIALYADSYSDWVAAVETLKLEDHYSRSGGGFRQHPAFKVKATAKAEMTGLLADFGLTPASRKKVPTIKKTDPDNRFENLI